MQVDYVSDLHLSHYIPFHKNPQKQKRQIRSFVENNFVSDIRGHVLVLAGDYSEYNLQTITMIETFGLYYQHVLVVFDNHDHYLTSQSQRKKYDYCSENRLLEIQNHFSEIDNVHILQNQVVTIDRVKFAGSRLWYNLTTAESYEFYKNQSNDSHFIFSCQNNSTFIWKEYHDQDLSFYNSLVDIDVMVSHIPPIQPINSLFPFNECYVSPVNHFKAKRWICGHHHLVDSFKKEDTAFYMNAIGYPSEENARTIQSFVVKVDDQE